MRSWLRGMGPFFVGAGVFALFGLLAILLEVQSPSFVLWSGIKVQGETYQGLTHYTYAGERYAIDNRNAEVGDLRHVPTTVWLDRSHPDDSNKARVESAATRWLDFGFVVGWFFLALVVLVAGLVTRWTRRRRRVVAMGEFGAGISDELVRRLLSERRRPLERREVSFDE